MIDLDNLQEIKKLDPKNVLGSVENFLNQCEQNWQEARKIEFPPEYQDIKNIVICGMGASAYGGYIFQSLFKNQLKYPLFINNDYHLPAFVNQDSLVVLSSYSGATEELLSCGREAIEKQSKITGITTGGELANFFKTNNCPALVYSPQFNPSGQPRLGMGYTVSGTIGIFNNLKLVSVTDDQFNQAILEVKAAQEDIRKQAKSLAQKILGSIPVIFAAEFLSGNTLIMRNQFNETSKSFAAYSNLPELNHHLMEGLKNPTDKKLTVLFISSDFYSDVLKKRVELTKDVVGKNGIPHLEYKPIGSLELSQVFNVLSFGGYLTTYLAFLYSQDPSLIPWVDYFKAQLEGGDKG